MVVLAGEVGGRWSAETLDFLRLLAKARARSEPRHLQTRAAQAWRTRWATLLACCAGKAFALSLFERRGGQGADGEAPPLHEVLAAHSL